MSYSVWLIFFPVDLRRGPDRHDDPGHHQGRVVGHSAVGRVLQAARHDVEEDLILTDVFL